MSPHPVPLMLYAMAYLGVTGGQPVDPDAQGLADDGNRTVIVGDDPQEGDALHVPASALQAPGATVASALGHQPGLMATQMGGAGSLTQIYVRGANPNQLRVYLDDFPMERADGAPVDLSELPIHNTDRITVWRQHAPIGYGGGIGGALRLALPPAEGRQLRGAVGGGSFGTSRLDLSGAYESTEGTWGVQAGVGLLRSRGDYEWLDDGGTLLESEDDRLRARENNDIQRFSGVASARRDLLGCRLRLVEHLLVQERGVPGSTQLPALSARHSRVSQAAGLSLRCPLEDSGYWTSSLGLRWQRDQSEDLLGEVYHVPSQAQRSALAPYASARGLLPIKPWLAFLWAGEGRYERFTLRDPRAPGSDEDRERARAGVTAGVRADVRVLHLTITPRIRLDGFALYGAERAALTWQATARWMGLRKWGLEARVAGGSGVRPPSLYELHGDGVRAHPNPALKDEQSTSGSVGVKWHVPGLPTGWRLALNATGFVSQVTDLIQWRRNSLWSASAENVQGATLAGLDGALELDLLSHLRATWGHTSLSTEIRSDEAAYAGNPLPLRPLHQDLGRLELYVGSNPGSELSLYAEVRRQTSHTVDQAGLVVLPANWTANAGLRGRWALGGFLGDEGALVGGVSVQDIADAAPVDLLGHPLPGRQWAAQLSWEERIF